MPAQIPLGAASLKANTQILDQFWFLLYCNENLKGESNHRQLRMWSVGGTLSSGHRPCCKVKCHQKCGVSYKTKDLISSFLICNYSKFNKNLVSVYNVYIVMYWNYVTLYSIIVKS